MTNEEAIKMLKQWNEDLLPYEDEKEGIECHNIAISALEKQIPKKPRKTRCALMCSTCGHKITEIGCKKLNRFYCKKCGQAIDWSDVE